MQMKQCDVQYWQWHCFYLAIVKRYFMYNIKYIHEGEAIHIPAAIHDAVHDFFI